MYSLVSAKGLMVDNDSKWVDIITAGVPISKIFKNYRSILLTLTNPVYDHRIYLDLYLLSDQIASYDITLENYFTHLGNTALPTTDTIPVTVTKYARYNDAIKAGYKMIPVSASASIEANVPESEKTWVMMKKDGIDYLRMGKSTLVSINGLYHRSTYDTKGYYAVDGMTSARIARSNCIGILNFSDIGDIEMLPITPEMIYKQNDKSFYRNTAYINTDLDLTDKSVMLVLGGYLHPIDNKLFYRVGKGQFGINFNNIPFFERYYESKKLIDLSSLKLDVAPFNPNQISVKQLLLDSVLTAYMTLSQSFLVVINNSNMFVDYESVRPTKTPNVYMSYSKPSFPLKTGVGKHSNYWSRQEDGYFALITNDSMSAAYNFNTVPARKILSFGNTKSTTAKRVNTKAVLMKIGVTQ